MSTSDDQWTQQEMDNFTRETINQMTMPIPETIWLVSSGFPRTDGLLGRVYLDRFLALQSKGDGEVVVELRLQPSKSE
jgi:hypothetical protein